MDFPTYVTEPEEDVELIMKLRPSRTWIKNTGTDDLSMRRATTIETLASYHSRGRYILNVPLINPPSPSSSGRTRSTIEKKLCEFCTSTIITTDLTWGMHHPSFESLQRSVAEHCTLCCQLANDINNADLDDTVLDDRNPDDDGQDCIPKVDWPVHRWSIRSPQRIDDSENVYATLIFRQVTNIVDGRLQQFRFRGVRLPQRTFYLFQQGDPARMQSLRPIGNHTNSGQTQKTIHEWIDDCDKNHVNCAGRADKDFVPTRLLDLDHYEDRVLVVDTRVARIRKPYTTVSYSWGKNKFVTLTADTIDRFMNEGIAIGALPRTIQEAIETTRMLGMQYIWIDSLCIIQGSTGDFQFEASLMLQVYRNCYINIAASDSISSEDGLFRARDENELFHAECQGRPNSKIFGNGIWRVVPQALWDNEVLAARLNTRGWVFQERLLSPRILHFASKQVFWDCATVSACETFRGGLPQPLDTGSNDRYWRWKLQDSSDLNVFLPTIVDQSLEQFWRNAIRTYSLCNLTVSRDKLIAIWGIVRFLIGALRERYAAGLWERNLEEQLAWHVVDCKTSRRVADLDAPSWSWAAIDGGVVLPDRFAAVRDYHVVNHSGQNITFDLYGPTRDEGHGPRTWSEQLQQYESRVKEIDEYRQSMSLRSSHMLPEQGIDMSPIPALKSRSIAIMGHIAKMRIKKDHKGSQYSLFSGAIGDRWGQAFPDDDYRGGIWGQTLCLILAFSINHTEAQGVMESQEVDHTCNGIGLLIDYRGGNSLSCEGHFIRKGAFQFSDVKFSELCSNLTTSGHSIEISSDYDPEKGFKIWLD